MVEVELSRVIIDENRHDQVIVLKEKEGERKFPIVIGFLEASSINLKLSGTEVPRPMTHDLLILVIEGLGAKLDRLLIDKLIANTFHAKLILITAHGEQRVIDSRPSDGIALAVRAGVPIFVDEEVLEKTSMN